MVLNIIKAILAVIIVFLGIYMLYTRNFELDFLTFSLLGILMILNVFTEFQRDKKSIFGYFFIGSAILLFYVSILHIYSL